MLNLHRALLSYRRSSPSLKEGSYQHLHTGDENCFVYLRRAGDQRILVALNFAENPAVIDLSDYGRGIIQVSTSMKRNGEINLGNLRLESLEGLVIEIE
jgi:glycosidase